jgi:hypothetical protein
LLAVAGKPDENKRGGERDGVHSHDGPSIEK